MGCAEATWLLGMCPLHTALGVSVLLSLSLTSLGGVGCGIGVFLKKQALVLQKDLFLPSPVYHAIFLEELTTLELVEKIANLYSISPQHIHRVYRQGPTGIHVVVSNEVSLLPDPSR